MNKLEEINKRKRQYGEMTQDDAFLIRAVEQLANVVSATIPAYTRLVLLQKMGPLGESPLWTKKIGDALDDLTPNIRELVEIE